MTRWNSCLLSLMLVAPATARASASTVADEALAGAHAALAQSDPGRAFELARLARAFDPDRSVEAWEVMGRAQAEMGEQAAAHRYFRRALAIADGEARLRVLARMQLARDELGLVRVDLQPGGATLFVDGAPAEYETGARVLMLRPGPRRLEARLAGHEPRSVTVYVTARGAQEVRIVLSEGAEDILRPAARSPEHPGHRWLTGNAILIGVGALSIGGSGAAQVPVPDTLADGAAFQLGLSSGLALGSALNLVLQQALDVNGRGSLRLLRLSATPLFAVAALVVAMAGGGSGCELEDASCPVVPPSGTTGASGTLVGVAISTAANIGLGTEAPIATSLAVAFALLAVVEGLFAFESSQTAEALWDAARGPEALEHEAMSAVTGGVALGFLGLAASSLAIGALSGDDELDLSVAAGPGTLTLSGTF